ncbi:MAG TPA: molecular chaperone DnaJ [Candidatus Nanoarchaeia archaeon]|nr:molecular chaperone DnaJ [Candidatus Nanoarchaeia archaeon]
MAKDYYKILGVNKDATKEEIKTAYKRLAKKHHPDLNKETGAADKFKEINEAASVLADDEKRRRYDQTGTVEGEPFSGFDFRDFMGAGFDFEGIFDEFFGGGFRRRRGPQRGNDLRYDLDITLEEAATGATKAINVPRLEQCPKCNGLGAESESDIVTCEKCNGHGVVRREQRTPFGIFASTSTCSKCKGQGRYIKNECAECDGTGLVRKSRKIEVEIPAGAEEGMHLRLRGEGEAGGKGAPYGDLFVVLHERPHDTFQREGSDIVVKVPIDFATAALGGEIEVPTLTGKATLKIPAGTQSSTIFRMRDKGIAGLHGGHGSEKVEVVVKVPEKLTKKQRELLEEFQKESGKKSFIGKMFE